MHADTRRNDLARTLFLVLTLAALGVGCFLVLAPFLLAGIWAAAIVIATWPLLETLEQRLPGKRRSAVTVLSVALLLLLVAPLTLVAVTIVDHVDDLSMLTARVAWHASQPPPEWLQHLPASEQIVDAWQRAAAMTPAQLQAEIAPYASRIAGWLVDEAGSIGLLVVQFLLTLVLCAVLYFNGESAARGVRVLAHRIAGKRGDNAVVLAAQAVRAVALGIVVTAVAQALLGGIGLAVAGVPYAGLLTAVMLLLCVAQIGVFPVLLPVVAWLFWSGDTGWGVVLALWTVFVGTMDTFLRPWLIRRGADLPMLLILAGVIGGLLAFGIVGLFVGPVLLAVSYRLLEAWVQAENGSVAEVAPAAIAALAEAPADTPLTTDVGVDTGKQA